MLEELKKYDTLGHVVLGFDETNYIIHGQISFSCEYNIEKICRCLGFNLYQCMTPLISGQRRLTENTYNVFFELLYSDFRPEQVYEENGRYHIDYEINLSGLSELNGMIKMLSDNIKIESRRVSVSAEEKEAKQIIVDLLTVYEVIREKETVRLDSRYRDRLAEMVRRGI